MFSGGNSTTTKEFEYPEFYSFPPFFTIQPILATRAKQLALWRELILNYHTHNKIRTLVVHECPLWKNSDIDRSLDAADIQVVMEDFCKSGHGEWEGEGAGDQSNNDKTRCRVLWRQPKELASDIHDWAAANGFVGSVCTLYELHSGEDNNGMSFQGADEELLRRALKILEDQGKCTIFQGETSQEDGIKFF
jgi:ESCRT-II complex subunit VPS25